jgi:hypothetical protein
MQRREFFRGAVLVLVMVLVACSGCSSTHQTSDQAGSQLANQVIEAPYGYQADSTTGASGVISPAVFDRYGGFGSPAKVGFVAGFKQSYVDYDTEEGIAVTLLEFRSPAAATTYLDDTAPKTLSYAAATHKPFESIPGAIEVDGTKAYAGNYTHGVVMAKGKFYVQLVYATAGPSQTPTEFTSWAKAQYSKV